MTVFASRRVSLAFGFLSLTALMAAFFFVPKKLSAQNIENAVRQARPLTPAGKLIVDAATNSPAVAPLTMNFVRSPDQRFLVAVNSGFGLRFNSKSKNQQTLSIIDLQIKPAPQVVQNIYFPAPNSANVGLVFATEREPDGSYPMFVAGGFENKIWIFRFKPDDKQPVSPANKPDGKLDAPFIDVSGFASNAPTPVYNYGEAAIYPTGIALSPDNRNLYVANNLGDSLGILEDWRETRKLIRVSLVRPDSTQIVSPYDVKIVPDKTGKTAAKVYVSLWGDGSIAAVDLKKQNKVSFINAERHPTAMILNKAKSKLFVVNSNADSVSIIDTATDKVTEKINVRLTENALVGSSPEGLALSEDEKTLFVANAHSNSVAVVALDGAAKNKSKLLGFVPTGNYASAVAVVGNQLFVGNSKGTGTENSSNTVSNSGRNPNAPNKNFPPDEKEGEQGGQYSVNAVSGNISLVDVPNERELFVYTQQTMKNNGLLGEAQKPLFANNRSPFKHVVYIIRENRTYDQVFGDLEKSGDGAKADGDANLAIFGAGEAAKSPDGKLQNVTPNARALALRFGLLDRFFVNAEASPDGHNWSTAAFSNDYVDKAFRWGYGGRGRSYDYEGFNRMPNFDTPANQPSLFRSPVNENDIAALFRRHIPYTRGNRDLGEPETLYLWDAARRAGLSYRNYGEFIGTMSAGELEQINSRKRRKYPDVSETKTAVPTKKSLEGNHSPTYRNFDMNTPDIMTTESYRFSRTARGSNDAAITRDNYKKEFRGVSRFGEWEREFRTFVAELKNGKDTMPALSILRLSNDHTSGLRANTPTPQFYVGENDYALGRIVEEISNSPYWKDTAIFVVEDDAQDGPDHVDAHRSPALVISAYNRQNALVHEFHNTVSLIRTMEICLGIAPMNFLDANAAPIDIFTETPDFTPFRAEMPEIALDNLMPPEKPSAAMLRYMNLTDEQNMSFADMANPRELNEIIWFSVKGESEQMPQIARLPAFDLLTAGIMPADEEDEETEERGISKRETADK